MGAFVGGPPRLRRYIAFMADSEASAVVVLTAGKPIEVQQPVDLIASLLRGAPGGEISFFKLTEVHGAEHWVNAKQVVEFHEPIG